MKRINLFFLQGLVAFVPIVLTLYAVFWLVSGLENLLRPLVPDAYYIPGSGLAFGIVLIFLIGVLVDFFLFEKILVMGQRFLNSVPVVKTIYSAFSDFFGFLTSSATDGATEVVAVDIAPGITLIGFVTDPSPEVLRPVGAPDELIAVYLPMSYMIGGYTLLLPRAAVTPLTVKAEDAMRLVLTAGVRSERKGT
ncbi:MAG: DUF502 domain-containing protein [Gammaproteobacteria bacterium]|nr:DUF502 domain-containing protein [Gammaproteobacteria bacterium]